MILTLQVLLGVVGIGLLYTAFFLYEDEEGHLMNRLQVLWESLKIREHNYLAWHLQITRVSAVVAGTWLHRVYGGPPISLGALATSTILMMASFGGFFLGFFVLPTQFKIVGYVNGVVFLALILVLQLLAMSLIALLLARFPRIRSYLLLLALGGVVTVVLYVAYVIDPSPRLSLRLFLVFGIVADFAVVALGRAVIAWSRRARPLVTTVYLSGLAILAPVICVTAIAVLSTIDSLQHTQPPRYSGFLGDMGPSWGPIFLAGTLFPTFLPSLLLFSIQVTFATHLLLWQAILRPFYSVVRHRVFFAHRKTTAVTGIYLILYSLNPSLLGLPALSRALLKLIGVQLPVP